MKPSQNSLISFFRELILVAIIIVLAFSGSRLVNSWLGERAIERAQFEEIDYPDAAQKALEEGKPLMLKFSAVWCGSCRKLYNQVLAESSVNNKIRSEYVYTRLEHDRPEDQKVFEQFGVAAVPAIIVMNADGSGTRAFLQNTLDTEQFLRQL